MVFESVVWAILLYIILSKFMVLLMIPIGKAILQQVILAVGAGIYEEFLFRVLLISGLSSIIGFVFLWEEKGSNIAALIIAAAIFSGFTGAWGTLAVGLFAQEKFGGINCLLF